MKLTREPDLAAEWDIPVVQFRLLRRRHNWAHVRFSRQDIRYTDTQIERLVHDLVAYGAGKTKKQEPTGSGLTQRGKRAAS